MVVYSGRTLLVLMLFFYSVGSYAQGKEAFYNNDSVDTCPLADKELIDTCYDLLDRNMMLETDGIYGQIAVIDAATSEVLAWATLFSKERILLWAILERWFSEMPGLRSEGERRLR